MNKIKKLIEINDNEMMEAAHDMNMASVENCMGRHRFYDELCMDIQYGGLSSDAVTRVWEEGWELGYQDKMTADQHKGWEDAYEVCRLMALMEE